MSYSTYRDGTQYAGSPRGGEESKFLLLCGSNDSTEPGNFRNMIKWRNVPVSLSCMSLCGSNGSTETGNFKKNMINLGNVRDSFSLQRRETLTNMMK